MFLKLSGRIESNRKFSNFHACMNNSTLPTGLIGPYPTDTSISSTVFNVLVLLSIALSLLLKHRLKKTVNDQHLIKSMDADSVFSSSYVTAYLHIFPTSLKYVKLTQDQTVSVTRRPVCTLCCKHGNNSEDAITFKIRRVEGPSSKPFFSCSHAVAAIAIGCVCGLFLHFIPCIWMSCDWGQNDDEQVRGAIWFGSWIVICILLCFRVCSSRGVRLYGQEPKDRVFIEDTSILNHIHVT